MAELPENRELTVVLKKIFQDDSTHIVDENGTRIDKFAFKPDLNSFSYDKPKYKIYASEKMINENILFFNYFFKDFIDKNTGMMGVSYLLLNDKYEISINDFVGNNVMNAVAYLGLEKSCKLLMNWKTNNQIEFRIGFALNGVNVSQKIQFGNDGNIIPSILTDNGTNNITYCSYLKNKCKIFFKPKYIKSNMLKIKYEEINIFLTQFCNSLSLICDSYISLQKYWIDFGESTFFNPRAEKIVNEIHEAKKEVDLSQSDVDKALNLVPKLKHMLKNPRYRRSYQRLHKSKKSYNNYDRAIELRIALDSLFTGEEERTPSVMMRNNAVLYFEEDPSKREKLCEKIQQFYTDASIIMHGGVLTKKVKRNGIKILIQRDPRHIDEMQKFCSDALIKMAEDGKVPNWDTYFMQLRPPA